MDRAVLCLLLLKCTMPTAPQLKVYWPHFLREGLAQIALPKKSVTHFGPPAPIVLTQYVRIGTDKRIVVYWTGHALAASTCYKVGRNRFCLLCVCECVCVSVLCELEWMSFFWTSNFSSPFWTRNLAFTSKQICKTIMDQILRKCVYCPSGEGLPRVNWVVLRSETISSTFIL